MTQSTPLTSTDQALLAKILQQARQKKTIAHTITARPTDRPVTLSFAQRRLWFLDQWEPGSPAYNISMAFHLQGDLDTDALRRAFAEIVRRHEVLRMVFTLHEEEPVQVPHPDPVLPLVVENLETLPEAERLAAACQQVDQDAARPFALDRDLPIRVRLFRLDQAGHVLHVNIHHIASDGWSLGILCKELEALYTAYRAGQPSPLPELPVQYADFAHWQCQWLQGETLERQLGYWKEKLQGAPGVLELPTDHARPAVRTYRGKTFNVALPTMLGQGVKTLAQQEGVTPFMILLSTFQLLLYRYTGQADIVVGTPIAGRNLSEIEGLIGFFVNTQLIRTDLSGNPSGRSLIERVRQATLDAFDHQDLPFEKLVEELHPQRDLSHNPLFQVMFNHQPGTHEQLKLPGLQAQRLNVESGTAKFDLNFHFQELAGELDLTVTYNTDLFEDSTVRRMVAHYQALLQNLLEAPQQPIAKLGLLTPGEETQLQQWAATDVDYPEATYLHTLFERQAEQTPERAAVYVDDVSYTYGELNARANQLAHYLRSLGVQPDVRVGLFMERSLDIMVALLGILKAGGAYVPIDPIYPPDRVRFMLEDVDVSIVLTESALASNLPGIDTLNVVSLDREWPNIAAHERSNPNVPVARNNLMYVLFTSGSTGRPKGVAVEHRNYINYFQGIVRRMPLEAGMHFGMVSTFATDLGTITFWGAFYVGGTVFIASYERATDPEALAAYYRRHRIDVFKLVPSHFEALLDGSDPAAIVPKKLLIITGEASYWDTVAKTRRFNPTCVVQDHYGVTETTCATLVYEAPLQIPEGHGPALPKGFPLGNVRIHILDDEMRPTPIGVPGALYIGGAGVTRGYVNRPALTAERFIPDPFSTIPGARLYQTGDLACYQPDGTMKLIGRMDFQVKIRGYRIELGEIETLLRRADAIQDAVVVARRDNGEDRLVAYVAPKAECAEGVSVQTLRENLRAQLPEYMVPTAFVVLERIPLNPNGKVDRFALPAPEAAAYEAASHVPPRDAVETAMAAIWCEILTLEKVGIDDNFFDLGGDSFKAIRVVRKLNQAEAGGVVSAMDLFKMPTIRQLAARQQQPEQRQNRPAGLLHELTRPVGVQEKTLNLVCVPYGGGSGILFQPLANAMPAGFSLYAVQIPGHDYSHPEEALLPLEEVARQCAAEIIRDLQGPVALYGHCVGGALALEITRQLEAQNFPVAGLIMGAHFPSSRLPGKLFETLHRLLPLDRWTSSRTIYEGLRALGGFSGEMDAQEREFVVRSLRHDVSESEDYYTEAYADMQHTRLHTPVLCIAGQRDRSTEFYEEEYLEWDYFTESVSLAVIPNAGHYFLKHQPVELAQAIEHQAKSWKSKTGAAPEAQGPRPVATRPGRRQAATPRLQTFFLVVLGQLISLIGTGLTGFALSVWAYQETGSVTQLSTILVAAFLPGILILPISGALADRHDRRLIMLISDSLAVCGVFMLALLLWSGHLQLWHVYITASIGSIASALQRPAYIAAITQLVPKRYLGQANGITQFGLAASDLLAPLLGGFLVVAIGLQGIILVDCVSFLFAIFTLAVVRFPNTLFHRQEETFWQAITGGWFYIIRRPSLVAMVLFFVVFNYLIAIVNVVQTPLVLSFTSAVVLGMVVAASGLGTLVGSLVMALWGGARRRAEGMVGFTLPLGLAILISGLAPHPIFPAIGMFGFGMALTLTNAHWQALIQMKVGLELQGRVVSMNQMLGWSMIPIGFLTAGPLVERVFEPWMMNADGALATGIRTAIGSGAGRGMGLLMIVVGALYIALAIAGWLYRPLRYMEDVLPDAVPDAVISADKDRLQQLADEAWARSTSKA
ncbi:MAG: amino acid adenylation domain-containing protein [Chloroflexota bacterium]